MPAPLFKRQKRDGNIEISPRQSVILVVLLIQTRLFDTLQPRPLYNKNTHRKNIETVLKLTMTTCLRIILFVLETKLKYCTRSINPLKILMSFRNT